MPSLPGQHTITRSRWPHVSDAPPLSWRGEFALETEPGWLGHAPDAFLSILGWLISAPSPYITPYERNLIGACGYNDLECPLCRENFSRRLTTPNVPTDIGSRAAPPRTARVITSRYGGKVPIVAVAREVRNHLLEGPFAAQKGGEEWKERAKRVVRLGCALWMTELAWEVLQRVGDLRRESVYFTMDPIGGAAEIEEWRIVRKVQEVADDAKIGVAFEDAKTGERVVSDRRGLWGRPGQKKIDRKSVV